jgi:hypothetical protein
MELVFDWIPRAGDLVAGMLRQDAAASTSIGETARQVASILGILLLTGLWLYLAMHRDRRMATLTVLCVLGLASGAGYALGREARLELLRGGVMQLLLFLEVFVDLTRGWRAALQTVVGFFVAGIVAASFGAALAASFGKAGRAGELIVELLVALLF